MTKKIVVDEMVSQGAGSRAEAERSFDSVFSAVDRALGRGERVRTPIGTIERKTTPERQGRNPATGETMRILSKQVNRLKSPKL